MNYNWHYSKYYNVNKFQEKYSKSLKIKLPYRKYS